MLSWLVKFRKNAQGATAIEFAFVVPVLLLLICGIVEFGMIMLTSSIMEGAAASAARDYKASAKHWMGAFSGQGPAYANAEIRDRILQAGSGFLNPNNLRVVARVLPSWGSGSTTSGGTNATANALGLGNGWGMSNGDSGYTGQIIQYEIQYAYFFMTPIIGSLLATHDSDAYLIRASMVVQNEPKVFWGSVY